MLLYRSALLMPLHHWLLAVFLLLCGFDLFYILYEVFSFVLVLLFVSFLLEFVFPLLRFYMV